jgi:CheY-like chemotaxis protein
MALRVLLADESSTIKKVMQLALQEYGVEVKAVPIGIDVMQVTKSFKPDIIFADVLLAKKNGYEVCAEIKQDPQTKEIPVVLMWSSFMEFDESRGKLAQYNSKIEKPFDADTLRGLIKDLVPQTQTNLIASYLQFPELPPIVESDTQKPETKPAAATKPAIPAPPVALEEEPEEFQQVPLPKKPFGQTNTTPLSQIQSGGNSSLGMDQWAQQDLSKFKIQVPTEDFSSEFEEIDLEKTSIAFSTGEDNILLQDIHSPKPRTNVSPETRVAAVAATSNPGSIPVEQESLSESRAEMILREEARAVLTEVAWKLLPDICERVVREELQKLLKDAERL